MSPSVEVHRVATFTRFHISESGRLRAVVCSLLVFAFLAIDAALRFPGKLDIWVIELVQRVHFEQLHTWSDLLGLLTDSSGAVVAWGVTLAIFAMLRWWLPVLGVMVIPFGGIVNETISRVLIHRTRPHLDAFRHVSQNFDERSFPSGHVVGAVLLYGYIWYVAGSRVRYAPLRRLIRLACVAIMLMSGFDRVWSGAHWPSDVGGAYALGLALLLLLIIAGEWIEHEAAGLYRNEGVLALYFPTGSRADVGGNTGLGGRVQALLVAIRPIVLALAPPSAAQPDGAAPEASHGH